MTRTTGAPKTPQATSGQGWYAYIYHKRYITLRVHYRQASQSYNSKLLQHHLLKLGLGDYNIVQPYFKLNAFQGSEEHTWPYVEHRWLQSSCEWRTRRSQVPTQWSCRVLLWSGNTTTIWYNILQLLFQKCSSNLNRTTRDTNHVKEPTFQTVYKSTHGHIFLGGGLRFIPSK